VTEAAQGNKTASAREVGLESFASSKRRSKGSKTGGKRNLKISLGGTVRSREEEDQWLSTQTTSHRSAKVNGKEVKKGKDRIITWTEKTGEGGAERRGNQGRDVGFEM